MAKGSVQKQLRLAVARKGRQRSKTAQLRDSDKWFLPAHPSHLLDETATTGTPCLRTHRVCFQGHPDGPVTEMRLGPGRGSASSAGPGQNRRPRFPQDFHPLARPTGPTGRVTRGRDGCGRGQPAHRHPARVKSGSTKPPPPGETRGPGPGEPGARGNRGQLGPRANAFPPYCSGRSLLAHARRRALPLAAAGAGGRPTARAARFPLASGLGREWPRTNKQ